MAKEKSEKKSFESKVRELDEHFVEEVLVSSPEKLAKKLSDLTKYRVELDELKENDLELRNAKEKYGEAGAGYKEDFKAIRMKQKYIVNLLKNNDVPKETV